MRYLEKFCSFEPPDKWLIKAEKLDRELRTKTNDEERLQYIEENDDLWQDDILKEALMEVSYGKCWYCETKVDRDNYHVDHFRPKARIRYGTDKDQVHTPGYWWLAFDWHNYRLACRYCNTLNRGTRRSERARGKGDWFPLANEYSRAREPEPKAYLIDEMPLLLDPTDEADPGFLAFIEESGMPIPAETDENTHVYERAKQTIEILNLADGRIVRSRKKLWQQCLKLLVEADTAYKAHCNKSAAGTAKFKVIVKQLRSMIGPEEPYSASVRSFLENSKEKYKWLKCILY